MLQGFFSLIDLFGIPIVINLFGKEKLKSSFGGFCSLLFFGFLIFALYSASNEMVNHLNPKTVSSRTFNQDPRKMILTSDNFPMAFGVYAPISNSYPVFIDDSVYILNLTYQFSQIITLPNGTMTRKTTVTPVSLEQCTEKHFGDHAFAFSGIDLSNLRCVAFDQPYLKEMRLQGFITSQEYGTLHLDLLECNSETSNATCADESDRKKYLEGSRFGYIYANIVIDPNNYTSPDARYQDIYSKSLSRSLYKETRTQLSHISVLTDSGWIAKEESELDYVIVDQTIDNSQARDVTEDLGTPLLSLIFEVSKLETTYTRSYKKILTVLAEVASLANTVLLVMAIALGPFLKLKLRESIVRELFDVKPEVTQKEKPNRQQVEQNYSSDLKEDKPERNKVKIELTRGKTNHKEKEIVGVNSSRVKTRESVKGVSLETCNRSQEKIPELKDSHQNSQEKNLDPPEQMRSFKGNKDGGADLLQTEQTSPDDERTNNNPQILMKNRAQVKIKEYGELNAENFESEGPLDSLIDMVDQQAEDERENEVSSNPPTVDVNPIFHHHIQIKELKSVSKKEDAKNLEKVASQEPSKSSKGVSLWEYLYSFVSRNKELKDKVKALMIGKDNIDERLDAVNMMKKMREIDKIRALFFDKDQLVLFNNLPKPEINPQNKEGDRDGGIFSYELLKDTKFLDRPATKEEVLESYRRMREKEHKTLLDERLLEIFNMNLKNHQER